MPASPVVFPRTSPTIVSGYRDPSLGVPTQRIKPDISDRIILWEPEAAPLLALLKGVRQKVAATQRQFDWIESEPYPSEVTISGSQTAGDTSIEVVTGQGSRVAPNMKLRNRSTGEIFLVTVVSTDTLTAVRGIGNTLGGAAMADGDVCDIIGTAFEDASDVGTSKTVKEGRDFNYTEITRTPFSISGRQSQTSFYGGSDKVSTAKKTAIEHKKRLEMSAFFGKRHSRTGTGGLEQTFTGGLEFFIASNVWDLAGAEPTHRAIVEALELYMRWGDGGIVNGNGKKALFCSPRWLTILESVWHDKLRINQSDEVKKIGLKITEVETTHGTLMLIRQPLFVGALGQYAFLVDLNHVRYRYHQGRDTQLLENRQGPGIDGETHEWLTDAGWEVSVEGAHAIWKGIPV